MSTVKTAVSLDEDLFRRAESAARAMNVSRSHLMSIALQDYLAREESRRMLDALNEVYAEPACDDTDFLRAAAGALIRSQAPEEW